MKNKVVYVFTSSFPYITTGESFLNLELKYLCNSFKQVEIFPLKTYSSDIIVDIPSNCIVHKPIIKNFVYHYILGIISLRTFHFYFHEFLNQRVYQNYKWLKQFIIDMCTTNAILRNKKFYNTIEKSTADDILYFYWGKGSANILPFINKVKAKKIVKFHGGDLYKYNYGGYIPIQDLIVKHADLCIFISKHGFNYFNLLYPELKEKFIINYLGTSNIGVSKKSTDGIIRILSCSNVIPLKRVELIFESLLLLKEYKIFWTHIGSGIGLNKLRKNILNNNSENLTINLVGYLPHNLVLDYYIINPVDIFINLSTTEGLPVSLMEAISFNVPIIATNVGGTSEIVNNDTGVLLDNNPEKIAIANAIRYIMTVTLTPKEFWVNNFSEKNYIGLINILQ